MAERVTNEVLAAMLRSLEKNVDGKHTENVTWLRSIESEAKRTNGRVNEHDKRITLLEHQRDFPSNAGTTKDWKVLGTGIGAVVLAIWGAVEVLRICFVGIGKLGVLLTGGK